jgi:hypothetical protein
MTDKHDSSFPSIGGLNIPLMKNFGLVKKNKSLNFSKEQTTASGKSSKNGLN